MCAANNIIACVLGSKWPIDEIGWKPICIKTNGNNELVALTGKYKHRLDDKMCITCRECKWKLKMNEVQCKLNNKYGIKRPTNGDVQNLLNGRSRAQWESKNICVFFVLFLKKYFLCISIHIVLILRLNKRRTFVIPESMHGSIGQWSRQMRWNFDWTNEHLTISRLETQAQSSSAVCEKIEDKPIDHIVGHDNSTRNYTRTLVILLSTKPSFNRIHSNAPEKGDWSMNEYFRRARALM